MRWHSQDWGQLRRAHAAVNGHLLKADGRWRQQRGAATRWRDRIRGHRWGHSGKRGSPHRGPPTFKALLGAYLALLSLTPLPRATRPRGAFVHCHWLLLRKLVGARALAVSRVAWSYLICCLSPTPQRKLAVQGPCCGRSSDHSPLAVQGHSGSTSASWHVALSRLVATWRRRQWHAGHVAGP